MNTESATPPIVVLGNAFHAVVLLAGADLSYDEVALHHVPLGRQQRRATRWMSLSVLRILIDCGAAVPVDRLVLGGATRGRAKTLMADSRVRAAFRAGLDEAGRVRTSV